MILKSIAIILLVYASLSASQENAQPRIAPALRRCYQDRNLFERDNRLPMTTNMLIELIRKVEDGSQSTLNMRQIATSILFRFKQDGIVPSNFGVQPQPDILPFAVNGFNFHKHRVLLTRLIQGNANQFPNGTLNEWEECALHFMISTSIETHVRNDESMRCNQLAPLRAYRIPREVNNEDIEMLKTPEMEKVRKRLHTKFGKYREEEEQQQEEENVEEDVEAEENAGEVDEENELLDTDVQQGQIDGTTMISQCPVENGVLRTRWGAISAGTVLTGIAAGLAPQQVTVRELIADDQMGNYKMARQTVGVTVDNRFAATLSGDAAESILRQSPAPIQVGVSGSWNNTAVPHWYFLSGRDRFEHTDAEIRGGVDGLLLGLRVNQWHQQFGELRLSQILDMYYSQRGIFGAQITPGSDTSLRSCNRFVNFNNITTREIVQQQTVAFTTILDGEMTSSVTLTPNSTTRIAEQATTALYGQISGITDPSCASTQTVIGRDDVWRTASDIYIFVDTTWPYVQIRSMIGHLLDNLDVNRFGTTYTIMNANDGTVMVRTTNQLSDFYLQWTQATHQAQPSGLNLALIVDQMQNTVRELSSTEQNQQINGRRSLIALVVTENGQVDEASGNAAFDRIRIMRETAPDLRWIFWAGGSPNRFDRFVRESARDLHNLRIDLTGIGGESVQTVASDLIHRIQQEPRRIINHRCGPEWNGASGDIRIEDHVEPRSILYYRIHPNYFFGAVDRRIIRIQGSGYSNINVCHSRTVEHPRQDNTQQQDQITCQPIGAQTIEIHISNACDGSWEINRCQPLFISIEGPATHDGMNLRCTDRTCRFPDSTTFTITGENLGCFSSVGKIVTSLMLIALSVFVTLSF